MHIITELKIGQLLHDHPDTLTVALNTPERFVVGLVAIGFDKETAVAILGKVVSSFNDPANESEPYMDETLDC